MNHPLFSQADLPQPALEWEAYKLQSPALMLALLPGEGEGGQGTQQLQRHLQEAQSTPLNDELGKC
jgi:hypothetical protein